MSGTFEVVARKAWAICGAFGAAPVPDGWLRFALSEAKMSEAEARSGVGELLKRHLATRIIEVNEVCLRFHPLVYAFARSMAGEDDRRAMALGITHWFEGIWDSEANRVFKARLTLPHVDAALQNGGDDPRVVRRLAQALRLHDRPESLARAVDMLRGLLARIVDHPIDDLDAMAWVRHELARSLSYLGSRDQLTEAEALLRSTLEFRDDGQASPSLVVTLNDIGHVIEGLDNRERLAESEQLLRRALHLVETLSGSHVIGMATVMQNLAGTLRNLGDRKRLEEAEQLGRNALRIEETALGTDDPAVSSALLTLAATLHNLGGNKRLLEAETHLRRALKIDRHAFPDGSRYTNEIARTLATVLRELGGQVHLKEAARLEAKLPGKRPRAAPPKGRR